jgi:hypothetical protein
VSGNDPLIRARRGDRRLAFAGLVLMLCGLLIVGVGLTVIPFLFPFALVAGGLVILVGARLRLRLGPATAMLAAGASVLVGLAVIVVGGAALAMGAVLAAGGLLTLAIVFVDAGRFPQARR